MPQIRTKHTSGRSTMWSAMLPALVVTAALQAPRLAVADPIMTPNRMAIVDGEPRFLLGLYENPKDDAVLKRAVDAGFNLIQARANRASLDRMHAHGAKAWINLGGHLDLSRDAEARKASLLKTVNALKDHPALLIWEGPDEVLWNTWYARHVNYYWTTEFGAMDKAVAKLRTGEPSQRQKADALAKLAKRCKDLFARALWQAFDAKRTEFWQRAGTKPPQADATMANRVAETRRVGDGIARGIQAVRQADPKHIIWLNHAPRNSIKAMQHFNRAADMAGCDIYPAPANHASNHSDLRTGWLTSVGLYTERMRAAAPGKACAMVLQGFGWRDIHESSRKHPESTGIGRRPKYEETRFMAFDAIVHGANAIMYWGTAYIEKDSQLWKDLLRLATELKVLQPALAAETIRPGPTIVSDENYGSTDGDGLVAILKRAGQDHVLIVVNQTPHGLAFALRNLPVPLESKTLYRLGTDEQLAVKDRGLRDGISGFNVHVYATSRRFEARKEQ